MPFHLAAFGQPVPADGALHTLPPVVDMVLPTTSAGFVLPIPLSIIAGWACSPILPSQSPPWPGLARARILAPSLLRVAYPYIRPISNTFPEQTDPNVTNLVSHPLPLQASETLSVQVAITPSSPAPSTVVAIALMWLCDRHVPVPRDGERFTLRFTATSATTVQGVWSPVGALAFDQSLPAGEYAVVGLEHWSPNAGGARLVFPGAWMRPGTLSMGTSPSTTFDPTKRTDRLFFEGGIGVYGTFNSFAPPSLEVLTNLTGDMIHDVYVTVIRVGDMSHQHPHHHEHPHHSGPTPGSPSPYGVR